MAALGAAVITIQKRCVLEGNTSKRLHNCTISYGDAVNTYTTPGISLGATLAVVLAAFGLSRQIDSVKIVDPGVARAYAPQIDLVNNTVRLFAEQAVGGGDVPLLEVSNAFVPAATAITVEVVGW
jgi:hypothetical protein